MTPAPSAGVLRNRKDRIQPWGEPEAGRVAAPPEGTDFPSKAELGWRLVPEEDS